MTLHNVRRSSFSPIYPLRKTLRRILKQKGLYIHEGQGSSINTTDGDTDIICKTLSEDIKVGDDISFRLIYQDEQYQIAHRVVKIEVMDGEKQFYTKGDANEENDPGYRNYEDIVGVCIATIPSGPLRLLRRNLKQLIHANLIPAPKKQSSTSSGVGNLWFCGEDPDCFTEFGKTVLSILGNPQIVSELT